MKKLTALLAGFLLASAATAQDVANDVATDTEEPQRRYTVEIIIFSYAEDASAGTEIFLPDEPPPIEDLLLDEDGNPILEEEIPVYGDDVPVVEETEEELPPTWIVVPSLMPADTPEPPAFVAEDEEVNPFQLVLLQQRVGLDLVHRRPDGGLGQDAAQLALAEVGDADVPAEAGALVSI